MSFGRPPPPPPAAAVADDAAPVAAAAVDGAPCGTDDDELVAPCWTSQSDSRGEKSQTRELLESWLLRLRLL